MFEVVISVLSAFLTRFKSRARLEAEVLALRHQVNILNRTAPKRVRFTSFDRLLFVWLYRLWPELLGSVTIVRPETVVRWHRQGFHAFWRWKSRGVAGRPRIPKQVQDLIREISLVNPLWGAPRIHGELLKLGIEVAQSTVAKYMVKQRRPPSQSWKTFLRNHASGIAAIDLFVVRPSISSCCSGSSYCVMTGGFSSMWGSRAIRQRSGFRTRSRRQFPGNCRPRISSVTVTPPTARYSNDASEQLALGTTRPPAALRGRTDMSNV